MSGVARMSQRHVDLNHLCLMADMKLAIQRLPAYAVRSLYKIDHFREPQGSYAVLAVRPDERLDGGSVLVLRCGLSFRTTLSSEL
jgi:hypothetical protein